MVQVSRKFTVDSAPEPVVRYLRDFANTEQWDPGTVSCEHIGSDPIAVGARWRNVSRFLGRETELEYEMVRDEADRVEFVGRNKTATTIDSIRITPGPRVGTAVIDYVAHVELNGLAKLAAPIARVAFEKLADKVETRMTSVLATLD